jgi:hypothetical protein
MTDIPKPQTCRSRLGGLVLHYPLDHPKVMQARRDLDVANLAEHVARVVDGWPRLTDEQLDKIAALLRTGKP